MSNEQQPVSDAMLSGIRDAYQERAYDKHEMDNVYSDIGHLLRAIDERDYRLADARTARRAMSGRMRGSGKHD